MIYNISALMYQFTDSDRAVPRMQFYAVEIARNKMGLNDWIYDQAHAIKN